MKKFDDAAQLGHIYNVIVRIESYVSEVVNLLFLQIT